MASFYQKILAALVNWPNPVDSLHASLRSAESAEENNKSTKNTKDGWRVAEVFGLWAAAIVGVIAIVISNRDASEQRFALVDQLKEMRTQRETNMEQLRANVDVVALKIVPLDENDTPIQISQNEPASKQIKKFMIVPGMINSGQTDARNLRTTWKLVIKPGPRDQVKPKSCQENISTEDAQGEGTLPPRNIEPAPMSGQELSIEDAAKAAGSNSTTNIFAVGRLEYNDVFPIEGLNPGDVIKTNHRSLFWCKIILPIKPDRGEISSAELTSETH